MSSNDPQVREVSYRVLGMTLCGRLWGMDTASKKVLAIHGWLDNAASFDRIAGEISQSTDVQVLAIDMPGQGRSDHKPLTASYNIFDDLPLLVNLVHQLDWPSFALVGHSRGAVISLLLTATRLLPIEHLVLLDGYMPPAEDPTNASKLLRKHAKDMLRLTAREPRYFPSFDDAVAARRKVMAMTEDSARQIALRSVLKRKGQYYWAHDPRLSGSSAVKFGREQLDAIYAAIECPILILVAEEGVGKSPEALTGVDQHPKVQVETMPGGHHCHMDDTGSHVVERILAFIHK